MTIESAMGEGTVVTLRMKEKGRHPMRAIICDDDEIILKGLCSVIDWDPWA